MGDFNFNILLGRKPFESPNTSTIVILWYNIHLYTLAQKKEYTVTAKSGIRRLGLIIMMCVALASCTSSQGSTTSASSSSKNPRAYADTQERRDYQLALNRSPRRIASNVPSVVEGRLYIAERKTGKKFLQDCMSRCATIVKFNDGYHLTLPVGFSYREDEWQLSNNKKDYETVPVTKLTYWDPVTHSTRTIVSATLASVSFPEALRHQHIKDLRAGDGGFISDYDIVETSRGLKVADFAPLAGEPNGALYDGDDRLVVPVFNVDGKLVVCTKNGWVPALHNDDVSATKKFFSAMTIAHC